MGQPGCFTPNDPGYLATVFAQQIRSCKWCSIRASRLVDADNVVILAEPGRVNLHQRRRNLLHVALDCVNRAALHLRRADPTAAQLNESVPVSFELQVQLNTHDTIVVVFQPSLEPFATLQKNWIDGLNYRGALEMDILRRGMPE